MAEAYGKLTGRPGICLVTRGPGATQAAVGRAHRLPGRDAAAPARRADPPGRRRARGVPGDRLPPDVRPSREMGRARSTDAERIPELLGPRFPRWRRRAGPGPVVLALPEDMLAERVDVPDASPYAPAQAAPAEADLERVRRLLAAAERPLVVVGGQPWSGEARRRAGRLVRARAAFRWPPRGAARTTSTTTSPATRATSALGPTRPCATRLRDADVLLVIGARLGDIETGGYTTSSRRASARRWSTSIPIRTSSVASTSPRSAIVSSGAAFASRSRARAPRRRRCGAGSLAAAHADYRATLAGRELPGRRRPDAGDGAPARAAAGRRDHHERRRQLLRLGASLLRVPPLRDTARADSRRDGLRAARGDRGEAAPSRARRRLPRGRRRLPHVRARARDRRARHGPPLVVLVVDNGMYGTIRMHQERHFPGRVSGTDLENPDFAALARAFGCHGERVERTEHVRRCARPRARRGPAALCSTSPSTRRRSRRGRRSSEIRAEPKRASAACIGLPQPDHDDRGGQMASRTPAP